jgi:hypothetical protein
VGDESIQELACRAGHLIDRPVKSRFIGLGWPGEATQLPNELQSRCTDFLLRGRWMEIMQSFDVSTHVLSSLRIGSYRAAARPMIDRAEVNNDA